MTTCTVTGCENDAGKWSVCEACRKARSEKIHQRRLEQAITVDQARDIEREHFETGHTWWRLVDDADTSGTELDELIEEILNDAWSYADQTLEPNPLPDVLELVVGEQLTFSVYDYEDYDGFDRLEFDNELVRVAQAAVDAAAASASFWGEGKAYYVDIRPLHADAIARFLEGC